MIFCDHCFADKEISEMIRTAYGDKPKKGECPVCHKKNVFLYDTDEQDVLTPYFENLLSIYMPDSQLPQTYPSAEKTGLIDDLERRWHIFSTNLRRSDIQQIIEAICKDTFEDDILLSGFVGIPSLYDNDYLNDHSLLRNGDWDTFVNELKTVNRYHSKMMNFKVLERYCSSMMKEYKAGAEFYRARISPQPEGFGLDEMSAPPAGKSSEGRANARGITCLYLADKVETALHEVRAGVFDYVSVGKLKLKKDIVLVNLRDIEKVSPFSEYIDPLDYAVNAKFLIKLNEEMGKELRRSDSTLDYVPTQYITDYIKSVEDKEGNRMYAGIEYNSTTYPKGFNLAIFDPDLFECVSTEVYEIKNLQYDYEQVSLT